MGCFGWLPPECGVGGGNGEGVCCRHDCHVRLHYTTVQTGESVLIIIYNIEQKF
jgi:hypothetical protein